MNKKTHGSYLSLAVRSGSDYAIVDSQGTVYTPEEAKAAWEAGGVTDYNLAFQRLIFFGFDVEALKAHYAAGKR